MNPKLKKVFSVLAVFAAFVGAIYLAVRGIAYVIAKALTEAARAIINQAANPAAPVSKPPASSPADSAFIPILVVCGLLVGLGMFLLKKFEHTNKALKTLGFVFIVVGFAGFMVGPFLLAIFF